MNNKKEVLRSLIGKKVNFERTPLYQGIYYPDRETHATFTVIDVGEDIITIKSSEVNRSTMTEPFYEAVAVTVFVAIDHINFIIFYEN